MADNSGKLMLKKLKGHVSFGRKYNILSKAKYINIENKKKPNRKMI